MAGCYGNSKEDRYFEQMLFDYLDSQEDIEDYKEEWEDFVEETDEDIDD